MWPHCLWGIQEAADSVFFIANQNIKDLILFFQVAYCFFVFLYTTSLFIVWTAFFQLKLNNISQAVDVSTVQIQCLALAVYL